MRKYIEWLLVVAMVASIMAGGHSRWHQERIKTLVIIGFLVTIGIMTIFYFLKKQEKD